MIPLTAAMKRALDAIEHHVAAHGVAPSIRALARDLGCRQSNAARLISCLIERGVISRLGRDGALCFGDRVGIAVMLPPEVACALARFCRDKREALGAVAADAIMLHIDAAAGMPADEGSAP